jgi:5-methyltetrahydrofolate--homocysteine methyltransferase
LEQVTLGKIVLGTVSGDLHDIGKTIAGTLLAADGFDVVDLGVDISTERFVRAVQEEQPAVLGMSSLLTTTAKELARVIEALKEAGIRDSVQVIVGGGAVTKEYAKSIGADGYGQDAELGVRTVKKMLSVSD